MIFSEKIDLLKKVLLYICSYGELGRYLIKITMKSRVVGFWNRLLHGKERKLSFLMYQCLMHSNANSKWLIFVKTILSQAGRRDIWHGQQNFNLKLLHLLIKKILTDQYIQEWRSRELLSSKDITKTRLFKYIENFTIKNGTFSDKKFWYFSYFCSKHRLWVLVRTASARRF